MDTTINIGVIGAGRMAQRAHIPNLLAEGCRIVAIADPRVETARLVAERFRIPHVSAEGGDVIARSDVDAVVIVVPDQFHAELSIAASQAGKHVFIEKPLATNGDDGRAMVRAARRAGTILSVAYQRRHDPAAAITKRLVDEWAASGEMGKPRYMEWVSYGGDWICSPDPLINADDRAAERQKSYGFPEWLPSEQGGAYAAFNNGRSHGLDLLLYLFGSPTSVIASYPTREAAPVVLFDWAAARTLFAEGAYEGGRWQEWLEVHYDHGWVRFSTPPALLRNVPGVVEVYRGRQGRREVFEPPYEWAFRREAGHFLRCIREGIPESPTAEEALRTLLIVEDVFRQAARMPAPLPMSDLGL